MNNEVLLSNEKGFDINIEQTKTQPQETLEFKLNKELGTFSFNPPINSFEEGKLLLAVTSFEAPNSVFNITDENKSFSTSTPSHWSSRGGAEAINTLHQILKLRSQKDIELHVEEFQEKRNQIKKKVTMNIFYLIWIVIEME